MNPVAELRRRAAGSTQSALAKQIGITRQYLSMILSGERPPGQKVLDFLGLREKTVYERHNGERDES